MRILKFLVDGQSIRQDPSCDFSGIIKGSKGYLQAEFVFNDEWKDLFKVAQFRKYSTSDPISVPIIGNKCMIPDEVTDGRKWIVDVVGKRGDRRLTTNMVEVKQIG